MRNEQLHFLVQKSISTKMNTVTLDIPLLIRLLEFAREDAKNDMDLHVVAENMTNLSQHVSCLEMKHYKKIIKR